MITKSYKILRCLQCLLGSDCVPFNTCLLLSVFPLSPVDSFSYTSWNKKVLLCLNIDIRLLYITTAHYWLQIVFILSLFRSSLPSCIFVQSNLTYLLATKYWYSPHNSKYTNNPESYNVVVGCNCSQKGLTREFKSESGSISTC